MTVFIKILDFKTLQFINNIKIDHISLSKNEIIDLSLYLFTEQKNLVNNMKYKQIKEQITNQKLKLFGIKIKKLSKA
jgi:hypothetical protein